MTAAGGTPVACGSLAIRAFNEATKTGSTLRNKRHSGGSSRFFTGSSYNPRRKLGCIGGTCIVQNFKYYKKYM